MEDFEKLISVITSKTLTEKVKVKKVKIILRQYPQFVNAKISNDILRSVTSEYYRFGQNNITLLHVAAQWNCVEVAQLLVKKGADVNTTSDDKFQNTPLHEAAFCGSKEVAELLLQHGANIESQDCYGNTPLHEASPQGHDLVVKLLLEKGSDANALSDFREKPLHKAVTGRYNGDNNLNIVKMLLDYDANPEIKDWRYDTPLHRAVSSSNIEAVKLLLARTYVNTRNERGQTPLHLVVNDYLDGLSKEVCEVAKLLLVNGANVHFKDKNGNTPLHYAALQRSKGVVRLFLEYGADINETDNYGNTPLKFATCPYRMGTMSGEIDAKPVIEYLINKMVEKGLTKPDFIEHLYLGRERVYSIYWDSAAEIEEMKKHKVGQVSKRKVSLFDIIVADENTLALYMNNKDIVAALGTGDYKEKFPINAGEIESQFQRGIERNHALNTAEDYYSVARLGSNINVVKEKFNEYIFHEIFKYANNETLQQIVTRSESSKTYSGKTENQFQQGMSYQKAIKDDGAVHSNSSDISVEKHDKYVTLQ